MTKETQAPDDWEVVRLGEIADIDRGLSWAREQESPVSQDAALPVVRIGNVQPQGFQMDDILYIRGVKEAERSRRSITSRTLVMVGSNGNRERVGNTFLANQQVIGHLLASFLIGIHPRNDVSERFLFSSLRSAKTQGLITESTAGSTGLKNLSLTWLRNFQVNLPPLPEQRAIAVVLDSIDDAIERTEAVITATEQLRDSLLHELLTRGVPGWHSEWKDAAGIGTVPACWDVVRLVDVAEVRNGTTPSRAKSGYWQNGVIPFVRTGQVHDVTIEVPEELITNEAVTLGGAVVVPKGSVLIAMIGQGKTRGMSARLGIEAAINQNFAAIFGAKKDFGLDFLFVWAKQNYSGIRALGQGSNQDALNCELVEGMRVPKPTVAEQRVISAMANCFKDALERARTERTGLHSLKSSASDALLTGHVRVSV